MIRLLNFAVEYWLDSNYPPVPTTPRFTAVDQRYEKDSQSSRDELLFGYKVVSWGNNASSTTHSGVFPNNTDVSLDSSRRLCVECVIRDVSSDGGTVQCLVDDRLEKDVYFDADVIISSEQLSPGDGVYCDLHREGQHTSWRAVRLEKIGEQWESDPQHSIHSCLQTVGANIIENMNCQKKLPLLTVQNLSNNSYKNITYPKNNSCDGFDISQHPICLDSLTNKLTVDEKSNNSANDLGLHSSIDHSTDGHETLVGRIEYLMHGSVTLDNGLCFDLSQENSDLGLEEGEDVFLRCSLFLNFS